MRWHGVAAGAGGDLSRKALQFEVPGEWSNGIDAGQRAVRVEEEHARVAGWAGEALQKREPLLDGDPLHPEEPGAVIWSLMGCPSGNRMAARVATGEGSAHRAPAPPEWRTQEVVMLPAVPICSSATVARLAHLAGSGDHAALDALARRTKPMLEEHARRALARHRRSGLDLGDAAEEVVAEVQAFLAAGAGDGPGWRRFEAARARGELDAWLYGIVRNKVRRRLRDARHRERFLGPASRDVAALGGSEPAQPDRALDAARALRLVGELPARERAALALWLEDAPSREIAAQLRFASPHAVDCCLARGKQRLRRMMLEGETRARRSWMRAEARQC